MQMEKLKMIRNNLTPGYYTFESNICRPASIALNSHSCLHPAHLFLFPNVPHFSMNVPSPLSLTVTSAASKRPGQTRQRRSRWPTLSPSTSSEPLPRQRRRRRQQPPQQMRMLIRTAKDPLQPLPPPLSPQWHSVRLKLTVDGFGPHA